MFLLAHLSDLHMASPPRLYELAGKRGLGFINWQRQRKSIHRPEVLEAITRDVKAAGADHIAVTGDLVNLSLNDEYARARAWLKRLGAPTDITVVPGNHDVYVRGARACPSTYWGDYMRGDVDYWPNPFPILRRRGDVALIAVSSAVPSGPFLATGRVEDKPLALLGEMLEETAGLFRIVLIHHPPISPPSRYLRRLVDAAALRRVLADKGAELLLHGHDHRHALVWLEGPRGTRIPAVGVPSASASAPHGSEDGAGYNLFRIDGQAPRWSCELIGRQRADDGTIRQGAPQRLQ
ncbi:MAG: metallophosphoesterase [Xanthobacteraceae bacterium]